MENTEQRSIIGIESVLDLSDGTVYFDRPDRSNREMWSTSKGGPIFLVDRTYPLSFRPTLPDILVEWIGLTSSKGTDLAIPQISTSDLSSSSRILKES